MTLSEYFGEGDIFYTWKGRVALYLLLKAYGIGEGDEVIVPGFTCVVVPNAICYLGAKPVYADIEEHTFNASVETIAPCITDRTRAILVQNTFGLSADLDPIMKLARERGLIVIEDCAHGLGATYKGNRAGTVTDAAFFSTQWSKPISTAVGGFALVKDKHAAKAMHRMIEQLEEPSLKDELLLRLQLLIRPIADNPKLHYPMVGAYRFLTQQVGLSVGSSSGVELVSTKMPNGFLKKMGEVQKRKLERDLEKISTKTQERLAIAAAYDHFFVETSFDTPHRSDYARHGMLRYSVMVEDKQQILKRAMQRRIPLGDWFISPLHPVEGDLTQWHYVTGSCPTAERVCNHIINLPTDKALTREQLTLLFD